MMSPLPPNSIILRDAEINAWLYFTEPQRLIVAEHLDEVLPALREIERLVDENNWYAAGFITYEAAPAFDSALRVRAADGFPQLWFGLYTTPARLASIPTDNDAYTLGAWTPSVSRADYDTAIASVKDHIARGETYQVNYTFRLRTSFTGSPLALFTEMTRAQPVSYAAYIQTASHTICSVSPELFFKRDHHLLTCKPMKGTVKRGRTLKDDEEQAAWLRASIKNRAENVMIVDMIRNDLGRIAYTGSGRVPALFTTERYRTLWQMTSTVTAETDKPTTDVLTALFPCASITGAPKVSTMNIIAALESTPRRLYTGAIGFIAPDRRAQFNVAIRTLIIDRATHSAEYGVGGGIVWDSTSESEYDEALLKARVLTSRPPEFSLIETMLWTPEEGFVLRERHLQRLADSAEYFSYPLSLDKANTYLAEISSELKAPHRVRLLLDSNGNFTHHVSPFSASKDSPLLRIRLANEPINTNDIFLYHKTTHRLVYDQARATHSDADDVLLFNERGELTEYTIGNLVVEMDGALYTSPISSGVLAGTLRAQLLEEGKVTERVLIREDLERATTLYRINSVRGWEKAELIK